MISIKTPAEVKLMAQSGQKLAAIVSAISKDVKAGITSGELEAKIKELIKKSGGTSTFFGFQGYPATSCISVNEEVVHGIPGSRVIHEGDIVGIDVGLRYKGFCTDHAITIGVGKIDDETERLLEVTKRSLDAGLKAAKPGNRIGDISHAIEVVIEESGFGIVRDLTGHGIGREPHEEPSIPNFGKPGTGPVLKEGMTLAIEPMVTLGNPAVKQLSDDWTIVTIDGSLAAHFEHTIAITKNGCRVLTQ